MARNVDRWCVLIQWHNPNFTVEIIVLGVVSNPAAIGRNRKTRFAETLDKAGDFLGIKIHCHQIATTLDKQQMLAVGCESQVRFGTCRLAHTGLDELLLLPPIFGWLFGFNFPQVYLSVLFSGKPKRFSVVREDRRFFIAIGACYLNGLFEFGVHKPKITVEGKGDFKPIVGECDLICSIHGISLNILRQIGV